MAINRRWRDRNTGEDREETCYVDCTAFARSAEVINQYMRKGRPMLVEGRLNYSQWEAQDGTKRSKLKVVVDNFQFLGGGPSGAGGPSSQQARASAVADMPSDPGHDEAPPSDDVPF
jgi:single-strand DNA-binding protein